eukprot:COSAG06_NODE_4252_length_4429_cov_5.719169_5_plen_130_part_00
MLRISEDPESLPPEERHVPGGASSLLIDHPAVLGVLHEIIGTELRLEAPGSTVRQKGGSAGPLHGGGPSQISPIFGYRTQNGQIHAGETEPPSPLRVAAAEKTPSCGAAAGMVRVIFEFSEIRQGDGGT